MLLYGSGMKTNAFASATALRAHLDAGKPALAAAFKVAAKRFPNGTRVRTSFGSTGVVIGLGETTIRVELTSGRGGARQLCAPATLTIL